MNETFNYNDRHLALARHLQCSEWVVFFVGTDVSSRWYAAVFLEQKVES